MSAQTATEATAPITTYAAYARPLWQRFVLTRSAAMVALLVLAYGYAYNQVQFFDGKLTNYFLLMDMAPILLMALPMTLIIITGEIDLSVASTLGLSAVVTGLLVHDGRRRRRPLRRRPHRCSERLPRRLRRPPVARGHDRHAGPLPGDRGGPD